MTREQLDELRDRLYLLAQTVEDVERDLTDDDADDERRLLNVLLYAAETSNGLLGPEASETQAADARTASRHVRAMALSAERHSAAQLPLPRTADNAPYVKLPITPPSPHVMALVSGHAGQSDWRCRYTLRGHDS